MADTQSGELQRLGERLNKAATEQSAGTLTCQWCSVTLPPGETICATCGSPGVPDDSMVVPSIIDAPQTDEVEVALKRDEELVEWWKEGEEPDTYQNSANEAQDPLPVILGLAGTAIVCIAGGVIVAPLVLASVFENSLGITVENTNDLRPLGAVLGLLAAAFIGAIAMWVTAPRR